MRSLASHFPRDRWRFTASGPPPAAASRWSFLISETSSDIARALASKLGEPGWAPWAPRVEEASARGREESSAAASEEKKKRAGEEERAAAAVVLIAAAAAVDDVDVEPMKRGSHREEEERRERPAEASRRGSAIRGEAEEKMKKMKSSHSFFSVLLPTLSEPKNLEKFCYRIHRAKPWGASDAARSSRRCLSRPAAAARCSWRPASSSQCRSTA